MISGDVERSKSNMREVLLKRFFDKTASVFALASIFLCPLKTSALMDPNDAHLFKVNAEWLQCKVDSDCTVVFGACGWPAPASQKYSGNVMGSLMGSSMTSLCTNGIVPLPWPNAKCKESKCVLER